MFTVVVELLRALAMLFPTLAASACVLAVEAKPLALDTSDFNSVIAGLLPI